MTTPTVKIRIPGFFLSTTLRKENPRVVAPLALLLPARNPRARLRIKAKMVRVPFPQSRAATNRPEPGFAVVDAVRSETRPRGHLSIGPEHTQQPPPPIGFIGTDDVPEPSLDRNPSSPSPSRPSRMPIPRSTSSSRRRSSVRCTHTPARMSSRADKHAQTRPPSVIRLFFPPLTVHPTPHPPTQPRHRAHRVRKLHLRARDGGSRLVPHQ
jgi:hypothetical protein